MDAAESSCRSLILVAEDDPHLRNLLDILLTDAGYNVVTVANGADAVREAFERAVDLLLLDLWMSGMGGVDACRAYHEGGGTAPVVLVTGRPRPEVEAAVEACGAAAFIPKPFDVADILETVARLVAR